MPGFEGDQEVPKKEEAAKDVDLMSLNCHIALRKEVVKSCVFW